MKWLLNKEPDRTLLHPSIETVEKVFCSENNERII